MTNVEHTIKYLWKKEKCPMLIIKDTTFYMKAECLLLVWWSWLSSLCLWGSVDIANTAW